MKLSVIIPTRNRCELLKITLESITHQSMDKAFFEVIVVDNGSTDNTKQVSEEFRNKLNLNYIYEPKPGLHEGRHTGLKNSKSEILVYADDDIEAYPTWLESISEDFREESVALVGGNNLPKYESTPPLWIETLWSYNEYGKYNGYYSLIDFGNKKKEINPFFVFGCNFSIRKRFVLEFGGFHPDGMPRDIIRLRGDGESYISKMILKNSYKTVFDPQASVFHYVPKSRMTIEYLYHRGFIQGISDSYTNIRESDAKENGNQQTKISLFTKIQNRVLNTDIKADIKQLINQRVGSDNEQIKNFRIGYRDGYNFHQSEVKNDNELLKWVKQDNYFK